MYLFNQPPQQWGNTGDFEIMNLLNEVVKKTTTKQLFEIFMEKCIEDGLEEYEVYFLRDGGISYLIRCQKISFEFSGEGKLKTITHY